MRVSLYTTGTCPSQVSLAVRIAGSGTASHCTVWSWGNIPTSEGTSNTGAWISMTMIDWLAVELLPQSSVAVQVRTSV